MHFLQADQSTSKNFEQLQRLNTSKPPRTLAFSPSHFQEQLYHLVTKMYHLKDSVCRKVMYVPFNIRLIKHKKNINYSNAIEACKFFNNIDNSNNNNNGMSQELN